MIKAFADSIWADDARWRVGNRDYGVTGVRIAKRKRPWIVKSPDHLFGKEKYFKRHPKAMRYAVRMARKSSGGTML
ncbi:hypothetical protein [Paeniglutamicibacter terrestris]|uniref:Uncharacterized protein n=1 Tax=Paeniglutamicibacter terrestris TaxID=2723403 RepID=A0ABX1G5T6_9MICC|nr:hypothetical protein [Paeniglutamicibacter terrestris]NKG21076.1 hypothetical protein [Paeniglutamicibacter terrestris]